MADMSIPWATDLSVGPNGDFLTVDGAPEVQQRIIRRALTNPLLTDQNGTVLTVPDYVLEPTYGGAVRTYIGAAITDELKKSVSKRLVDQALQEPEVTPNPPPVMNVGQTIDQMGLTIDGYVTMNNGGVTLLPKIEISD